MVGRESGASPEGWGVGVDKNVNDGRTDKHRAIVPNLSRLARCALYRARVSVMCVHVVAEVAADLSLVCPASGCVVGFRQQLTKLDESWAIKFRQVSSIIDETLLTFGGSSSNLQDTIYNHDRWSLSTYNSG